MPGRQGLALRQLQIEVPQAIFLAQGQLYLVAQRFKMAGDIFRIEAFGVGHLPQLFLDIPTGLLLVGRRQQRHQIEAALQAVVRQIANNDAPLRVDITQLAAQRRQRLCVESGTGPVQRFAWRAGFLPADDDVIAEIVQFVCPFTAF